jgi:hypothetical protein
VGTETKDTTIMLLANPTIRRLPLNVLTHSSEAAFKSCRRRFFYRYVVGLVPSHETTALRLGTAYHAGLEELKHGRAVDEAIAVVRGLYADAVCPPWSTYDEMRVEEETAIALVRGFAWRYANDGVLEYVAVERKFDLAIVHPLTGRVDPTYRNQGKIDGIAKLPDGRLAIVEHKTTGESIEPDSDYWLQLGMDSQISRYYLAARAMGFDVSTIVYDVVHKPQIKPKNVTKADQAISTANASYYGLRLTERCPKRETPSMYGARLLNDIQSRPEHYFARKEIPRLESDLEEFVFEQWHIAKAIADSDRHGRWFRTTSACKSPYRCTYLNVCQGYAGDPEQQIPAGFKIADVPHPELAEAAGTEQQQ